MYGLLTLSKIVGGNLFSGPLRGFWIETEILDWIMSTSDRVPQTRTSDFRLVLIRRDPTTRDL